MDDVQTDCVVCGSAADWIGVLGVLENVAGDGDGGGGCGAAGEDGETVAQW